MTNDEQPPTLREIEALVKARQAKGDELSVVHTETAGIFKIRVDSQLLLDRYWRRADIEAYQYHAGCKLFGHWRRCSITGSLIGGYRESIQCNEAIDVLPAVEHRQHVSEALKAVPWEFHDVLICVVLADQPAGKCGRDGVKRLRQALHHLAVHYRMARGGTEKPPHGRNARRWYRTT